MEAPILIDPASAAGIPAPFWFIQFFKVLGFTLHAVPMNLWFAGLLVGLVLHLRGNQHARRFAGRLLKQMPIIVAFGINFGIVPLLFIQLAYFKVFYPATILMAWFWLAIIGLITLAYYGVYAYAWGIRNGSNGMERWRIAAGWVATLFFIVIGFVFANAMSLIEHIDRWHGLWRETHVAGAALGTALNVGDPTLWPRWLLMFGLALGTTAVWPLVDVFWLAGKTTSGEYRAWAVGFAGKLYTVAMLWAAAAGLWYVFVAWSPELRSTMFQWPMALLTIATAVAPGLPWLLIQLAARQPEPRALVAAIALGQFGVLGLNAISRQVVQNWNVHRFVDIAGQPTDVQWSPLAMFLIVFVLGVGVVGWMLVQVRNARAV